MATTVDGKMEHPPQQGDVCLVVGCTLLCCACLYLTVHVTRCAIPDFGHPNSANNNYSVGQCIFILPIAFFFFFIGSVGWVYVLLGFIVSLVCPKAKDWKIAPAPAAEGNEGCGNVA